MIVISIDVTKLDKARFVAGKNGAKYCDLVLIDHQTDTSDGFVKQGVSKEERAQRIEMPIIGNFRRFEGKQQAPQRPQRQAPPKREEPDMDPNW